jgi:predicted Fe-Mo cluster-binding NifX family protein
MRLCFPVLENQGFESTIYGHFASAPIFVVIDTDTGESVTIPNSDELAPEAGCNPFKALINKHLDAVVVGGIGDGLLQMVNMMGITVFQAQSASIKESVELFCQNALDVVEMQNSADEGKCGGDDDNDGCNHSHSHDDECEECDECDQCLT